MTKRFDFKRIVTLCYVVAFAAYLILGLQPAGAVQYEVSGALEIPSINLSSDVTTLELKDHKLNTPDTIVGSYSRYTTKTLLIGHSTTVFKDLNQIKVGETITYNGKKYLIKNTAIIAKPKINMDALLAPETQNTIIIMTCAGEILEGQDATHRLVVTATEL